MRAPGLIIFAFILRTLSAASPSYAEDADRTATQAIGYVHVHTSQALFAVPRNNANLGRRLAAVTLSREVYSNRTPPSNRQATATGRQRSTGRKVLGAALGGVGGFFGGGYLGAAIEGDRCNCDDPGLMGALIGAPIGAAVGAILGFKFF